MSPDLERRVGITESTLLVHAEKLTHLENAKNMSDIDRRLRTVEKLVWIATGGTVVISALSGYLIIIISEMLRGLPFR